MKFKVRPIPKALPFFLSLLLTSLAAQAQTTHWVSNRQDGIPVDFTSLQAAINAASAGDILMVYPSQISYGNITLNKPLEIIGLGFQPDINTQPTLEIATEGFGTILSGITVQAGADGGSLSSMDVPTVSISGVAGFTVERCRVRQLSASASANLSVSGSYFTSITFNNGCAGGCYNLKLTQVAGAMIENNIFDFYNQYTQEGPQGLFGDNISISSDCSAIIIQHNIFQDFVNTYNSEVLNNVFLAGSNCNDFNGFLGNCSGTSNANVVGSNNSVHDNVFVAGVSALYPGNTTDVGASAIFVGYPNANGHSFDLRFQLAPGSPAAGAGMSGVDCGVFGGPRPYKASGIYNRPLIYELDAGQEGQQGGNLNVTIKVRSEN
ncbi:MAG: hypothetical protein KDC66_21975 [Phaeodactylibacter sp.]|nr:hypothetical protein [Phaeodactylibacter sp.]MCB9273685.1 hypothetical protein [Lewinellaceae bacterium]